MQKFTVRTLGATVLVMGLLGVGAATANAAPQQQPPENSACQDYDNVLGSGGSDYKGGDLGAYAGAALGKWISGCP